MLNTRNKYAVTVSYIIFILVPVFNGNYSAAQTKTFSTVKLSLNASTIKNKSLFNHYWTPKRGLEASLETPFYYGVVQSGLISINYKANRVDYKNHKGKFIFLGWGKELELPLRFVLYAGFKVGSYLMRFEDDSLSIYQQSESEMAASLSYRLSIYVWNEFYLNTEADLMTIFTSKKIHFFLLSAGIAYKFSTPSWLKEFLN